MAKDDWKKVEINAFKFDKEGDVVEGKLMKVEDSKQYDNKNYTLEHEGKGLTVFGTTALDTKMSAVSVGQTVKILFLGEKKSESTGRMYKDFDVFVK